MKTFMEKKETVERKWYVIDAANKPLGRVATKAAHVLRGKHKVTFTPHIDYLILVNGNIIMYKKCNIKMHNFVHYFCYTFNETFILK